MGFRKTESVTTNILYRAETRPTILGKMSTELKPMSYANIVNKNFKIISFQKI